MLYQHNLYNQSHCIILIIYAANPVIADGNFMCVPAKVFNNSMRATKKGFSVHYPVFLIE